MNDPAFPDALPAHYRLHWYVLERVLGQGGFGITYLARDSNLDAAVAIKEYLPIDVATRRGDGTVRSRTDDQQERYRWGLERFIQEARTLARFDHPNIVRALSVFEHNSTAYMVMRFEEGQNLGALLEQRRTLPEAEIRAVLLPILDGLALVHGAGFIHRDIKPENIHIRSDGTPVLLDFGSARSALGHARTVTILVAPGYAPFEQYYANGENQGPWTDIYGLGATCYRALSGAAPMDAIARSKGVLGSTREILEPATHVGAGRYSARFLRAVDHALEFSEKDRPQSVVEWRAELLGDAATVNAANRAGADGVPAVPISAGGMRGPLVWTTLGALIAFGTAAWWLAPRDEQSRLAALEAQLAEMKRSAAAQPLTATPPAPAAPGKAAPPAQSPEAGAGAASVTPPPAPAPSPASAAVAQPAPPALPVAPKAPPELRKAPEPRLSPKPIAPAPASVAVTRSAAVAKPEEARTTVAPTPSPPEPVPPLPASEGKSADTAPAPVTSPPPAAEPKAIETRTPVAEAARPPSEPRAAFEYWRKRAGEGDAEALFRMGEMYATGSGGNKVNNKDAYIRYALAARAGHAGARARQDEVAQRMQRAEVRAADDYLEKVGPLKR